MPVKLCLAYIGLDAVLDAFASPSEEPGCGSDKPTSQSPSAVVNPPLSTLPLSVDVLRFIVQLVPFSHRSAGYLLFKFIHFSPLSRRSDLLPP